MSLFSAFIRDAWQQPVVRSDVYIAIRTDGAEGSGTFDDPYNGAHYVGGSSSNSTRFDAILSDSVKVPEGTTVHLGPTGDAVDDTERFLTRGYNHSALSPIGWGVGSRSIRLVGAGMFETVLKLVKPAQDPSQARFVTAIGNSYLDFAIGFEASDFTVDCNVVNHWATTAGGAVAVTGKHVYLRRLRAVNFGATDDNAPAAFVFSTARADPSNGNVPTDCVIDTCAAVSPYTAGGIALPVTCLHLGAASGSIHTGCVIRNCYVEGNTATVDSEYRGMTVNGGVGTIVECNRILHFRHGGPFMSTQDGAPNQDLVARDNYLYNVIKGIRQHSSGPVTGRLILEDNVIELADAVSTGIEIDGGGSHTHRFTTFIARGNAIRPKDNSSAAAVRHGIVFNSCKNVVVQNNVIDLGMVDATNENDPNNSVEHDDSCETLTMFNNRKSNGEFLPSYDSDTELHDWELTDEAENAIIGL